jgi:hypothetical protein
MYEVLSQLCFLKPMLKFSVQTFYQPLFSIFPSTILFPSAIFPSKTFPHQKAQSKVKASSQYSKAKSPPKQKAKSQAKGPKAQSKAPKAKAPLPPSGVFYSSKQVEPRGSA